MDHNCESDDEDEELIFSSSSSSRSLSSDKPMDLKQGDKESILKPFALVTAKPKQERRQQTTTPASAVNSTSDTTFHASWEESYDSLSSVLSLPRDKIYFLNS